MKPKLFKLDSAKGKYFSILVGPPKNATLKSGFVVLGPGDSVGEHSTEDFEELIVVLSGEGYIEVEEVERFPIKGKCAFYCPPNTRHNVVNTGRGPLSYVFVVAKGTSSKG